MSTGLRSAGDVTLHPTLPGSTYHRQKAGTDLVASIDRQQPIAAQRRRPHDRNHLDRVGITRQRSFPITLTKPLAASSFRGLSTRAAISGQPTSHRGPHRKTFRIPDLRYGGEIQM